MSAAVAAAAAPKVVTAGPMAVAVAVVADPMVMVAEDWHASVRPGPGSRPPRPHLQSSIASGRRPPQPRKGVRDQRPVGATQPVSPLVLCTPGATQGGGATGSPFALVQGAGGRRGNSGAHTGRLGTSD
jgi:hypothetical protein